MKKEPKVVAIVQARMGSKRLPGKVLADIEGYPMLWHVINRVSRAKTIDEVAVATSTESKDCAVSDLCSRYSIKCFNGKENDVLDRFYWAAVLFKADAVVRVTADCPMIDPNVIDGVVGKYMEGGYDYVTNTMRYTYPDGLDVEVFSFSALERAWKEAKLPAEREHVTPYIRTSASFRVFNVENDIDLSSLNLRWTVDDFADLEFVRSVYRKLGANQNPFCMVDVLELLKKENDLMEINADAVRNEGYYRSIAQEDPLAPLSKPQRRSEALRVEAERLIPSCTQTFSKGPSQYVQGVAPVFLNRGSGSHIWDVDGNEYIDYPMALGPIILGHNYPAVTKAVVKQIKNGTTFSLPHPLEIELAKMLVDIIPCAEMVRFGKNGSDATSGAVRLARAYTGRDIIACCGYHGWQDWFIGTTLRNRGVPRAVQELTIPFEYNNIASLESIFNDHPGKVAVVIMEPIGVVEPESDFLKQVRELTIRENALLIFDEIITGFRLALGGAQEYFGVKPDLACFGKAMANGYPLSAVVGAKGIMELFNEVFFSFTFGGETMSLAAAKATITEIRDKKVIGHLWEYGQKLKDGYNVLAREFGIDHLTECIGLPPRTVVVFKDETGTESLALKSLFQQECLKRGVLFSGGHNISYSHRDSDVDYTLRAYRAAMEILADASRNGTISNKLEGSVIQPIFRKP